MAEQSAPREDRYTSTIRSRLTGAEYTHITTAKDQGDADEAARMLIQRNDYEMDVVTD
jgi:hypothetical protein